MYLSEKLVGKYQNAYEKKFGKKLTTKRAEQELSNLVELIKLIKKER